MKTAAFSAAELRFWGWIPRAPDLSDFYAKGRGGLQPGASRDCRPPWGGRPKADRAAGSFARRSGKADCAARTSSRRSAKADCAARSSPRRSAKADRAARTSSRRSGKADRAAGTSPRRSGKADYGGRLCPARGFFGRAAGRNGALPYIARKSRFLRNGDVWATESLFLFAVLWLAILPDPSETGIAGGEKPAAPNPGRPAAARPTTATGSRFLRRQRERPSRRPRPSPPAREGSLGAPNDRTFPPGAERKARKRKGKEEPLMKRAPPL